MVGEVVGDRYELEELVGAGGMSSVYKAHDRLLERDVALKILHPTFAADAETIERFRREARAVAQLSHPNIVTVIDRGEDDGRQYIVFEYVDGESVKAVVERGGGLPVRTALETALQIARALAYAHTRGIVHRDVKPQNVLVDQTGRAKVTDFGIARATGVDGVTQTGTVMGTSSYIAPEQASGGEVGPATDVYSLGAVLYELLTGEPPFTGDNFVTVAMRHVHDPVPNVLDRRPDVPPRLAAAVERALAKDPAERFASMEDFATELEACLLDLDDDSDRDATLVVAPRERGERVRAPAPARGRRRIALPLVLLLAGLALAAAVAVALVLEGGDGVPGRAAPSHRPVRLAGIAAYDPPPGDGQEHDSDAPKATDQDLATAWTTETYHGSFSAQKSGVGLVLDARRRVALSRITVRTDTPAFTAEIRAGDTPAGPFRRVSPSRSVAASATFSVEGRARYWVVWITDLSVRAHVNEVTARS